MDELRDVRGFRDLRLPEAFLEANLSVLAPNAAYLALKVLSSGAPPVDLLLLLNF